MRRLWAAAPCAGGGFPAAAAARAAGQRGPPGSVPLRVGAPEGLVKSCIIIPFVGDTGDVRLLPETELWMAFTIPGCTNGVLARVVVRVECFNSHRGCHVKLGESENVKRV